MELRPEELASGPVFLPVVVKSNVLWAVTAPVLSADRAEAWAQVLGGLEVSVGAEEVPLLSGRLGKHELGLLVKLGLGSWPRVATLVLRVANLLERG